MGSWKTNYELLTRAKMNSPRHHHILTSINVLQNFNSRLNQLNFTKEEDVSKLIMIVLNMGIHFKTANLHKPRSSAADDPPQPHHLMQMNCWINILPYLREILSFIKNYQLNHSRTNQDSKKYIESDEGYFNSLFMYYLLMHSITIKYILSHYQLYSLTFDICMKLFHILYIQRDFGVTISKPPTKEQVKVRRYVHEYINTGKDPGGPQSEKCAGVLDADVLADDMVDTIFEEGTETSRELRDKFNESFIYTAFYWKQKHFEYLCHKWNLEKFVRNDIIKRLLWRAQTIPFSKEIISWEIFIVNTINDIIDWFHVIDAFTSINFKKRKNETYIRKLFLIWFQERLASIAVHARSYWKTAAHRDDIRKLMNRFMETGYPYTRAIKKRMLNLMDDKSQRNAAVFNEFKRNYYEGRGCCNPECRKTRWTLDHEYMATLTVEFEQKIKMIKSGLKHIKIRFRRCKKCRVAVYCSKLCQKRHWNLYGHKEQCVAICEMSKAYC